ncbi:GntR family transcriptional regulator [Microbacterium sp. NPDC055312]
MGTRSHILAEELSAHLRERILSNEFEPGASVTETGVATEYGVARPTARSALDRLVQDDLLVRQAHASLRVKRVLAEELPDVLDLLEFLEGRALAHALAVPRDLRGVRAAAEESVHKFLHALVQAGESDRLTRFHRQTTFALLLGTAQGSQGIAPDVRASMRSLADAVFRADESDARTTLGVLQASRREATRLAVPVAASAPGARGGDPAG